MQQILRKRLLRTAIFIGLASVIVGCSAAPAKKSSEQTEPSQAAAPARIEIQEAVGFTLVEDAYIDGDVRLDYDRAHELLLQGRTQDGIELLKTVAAAAPNLSAPHIDLAIAYQLEGDLAAAEMQLKQALDINPHHPVALNELGIVYRKTARFAQARQSYQAALDVYPGFHYARRNLGVLCDLYLSDLKCAVENYEAYMATVDSDDEAAMWLKNARFRSGQVE
jgi:Flp pilus assembly protein TadD